MPKTTQNRLFLQNEGSRVIYNEKMTIRLSAHLEGPLATLLMSAILAFFPNSTSNAYLKVFLDLD